MTEVNDIKVISIDLENAVTSVYKPPNILLEFHKSKNFVAQSAKIIPESGSLGSIWRT